MEYCLLVCCALFTTGFSQQKKGSVERGKYLAENVAMCVQCHTPRDASGSLIWSKLYDGAPVPVQRPGWQNSWAEFAPRIAGLPQYSDEQMMILLTAGIGREGKPLRSPMPTFHMTREDAEDLSAFLKAMK